MTRVFGGFDSLSASDGGIARVGRLVARVASDPDTGLGLSFAAATLNGLGSDDWPFQVSSANGSRLRFAAAVTAASLTTDLFVYNFLGLARTHGLLPVWRRPFMAFLAGIEVWPGAAGAAAKARAARRAVGLLSISQFTKDKAIGLDPTFERAEVCWLATEADDLPHSSAPPPPRVLIVGRMAEGYKGHAQLIDCWPRVVSVVPEAVLSVAGGGPLTDEYRRRAAASTAAARIEFLGFVPEAEMPALWARTAVFAMPSQGEGFGLVYIEAMRYGVPVVASVHDSGREVNADGVSGYNVDLSRPGELPDRLVALLRDRDLAGRLGAGGRDRWAAHFRYSAFRDRFTAALRPHLRRPSARPTQ